MNKFPAITLVVLIGITLAGAFWIIHHTGIFAQGNGITDWVCSDGPPQPNAAAIIDPVSMLDASDWLGEHRRMATFGLSVGDINGDRRDDIILGSHGFYSKVLIGTGSGFRSASDALSVYRTRGMDTHAHTLADFDNDGDPDLIITGGGADGVGKGAPNQYFRNDSTIDTVIFTRIDQGDAFAMPRARSRAMIPLASANGRNLDLYFTALPREDYPNQLFLHAGSDQAPLWSAAPSSHLPGSIVDHGKGLFADLDGDSHVDYLVIERNELKIYWHPLSNRTVTTLNNSALSTVVADFNNDGLLDIYAGRFNAQVSSDNVSATRNEIIYAIYSGNSPADREISFTTNARTPLFNLTQHVRKTEKSYLQGGKDIYLGQSLRNPEDRKFRADATTDVGKPDSFDKPGVYIWFSDSTGTWHLRTRFYPGQDHFKGYIRTPQIVDVTTHNLQVIPPSPVSDIVFFNRGGGEFESLCSSALDHRSLTAGVTAVDFNNDGWVDIAGTRRHEPGAENPAPFLLINNAAGGFSFQAIQPREEDKLNSSDLIVHGFFNDDDKPDLVLTNGYGQPPSNKSLARLLLNDSRTDNPALLLQLEGDNANRPGIGATLTLYDRHQQLLGYRVQGMNINISQDTNWQHFGLGDSIPPYRLVVAWPDNSHSEHIITEAGRHRIKQPSVPDLSKRSANQELSIAGRMLNTQRQHGNL